MNQNKQKNNKQTTQSKADNQKNHISFQAGQHGAEHIKMHKISIFSTENIDPSEIEQKREQPMYSIPTLTQNNQLINSPLEEFITFSYENLEKTIKEINSANQQKQKVSIIELGKLMTSRKAKSGAIKKILTNQVLFSILNILSKSDCDQLQLQTLMTLKNAAQTRPVIYKRILLLGISFKLYSHQKQEIKQFFMQLFTRRQNLNKSMKIDVMLKGQLPKFIEILLDNIDEQFRLKVSNFTSELFFFFYVPSEQAAKQTIIWMCRAIAQNKVAGKQNTQNYLQFICYLGNLQYFISVSHIMAESGVFSSFIGILIQNLDSNTQQQKYEFAHFLSKITQDDQVNKLIKMNILKYVITELSIPRPQKNFKWRFYYTILANIASLSADNVKQIIISSINHFQALIGRRQYIFTTYLLAIFKNITNKGEHLLVMDFYKRINLDDFLRNLNWVSLVLFYEVDFSSLLRILRFWNKHEVKQANRLINHLIHSTQISVLDILKNSHSQRVQRDVHKLLHLQ